MSSVDFLFLVIHVVLHLHALEVCSAVVCRLDSGEDIVCDIRGLKSNYGANGHFFHEKLLCLMEKSRSFVLICSRIGFFDKLCVSCAFKSGHMELYIEILAEHIDSVAGEVSCKLSESVEGIGRVHIHINCDNIEVTVVVRILEGVDNIIVRSIRRCIGVIDCFVLESYDLNVKPKLLPLTLGVLGNGKVGFVVADGDGEGLASLRQPRRLWKR